MFLGKNLKYLRKQRGLNQDEMQAGTGVGRGTWSNYEKEDTEPSNQTLIDISNFFGVTVDELLKVDIELNRAFVHLNEIKENAEKVKNVHQKVHPSVHLSGKKQDVIGDFKVTIVAEPETKYDNKMQAIPVTDMAVAAGGGMYNEGHYETVDAVHLPTRLVKPGHTYLCVKIKGTSMAPTLQDGGYVIIRLLDKGEWAKMPDERVFVVIDTDGKAYLKRVKNRFKQGFIVLRSDSPEQVTFPSFNLETKEITAIWYVEWYFTAKMPNVHDQFYSRLQQLEDRVDDMQAKQLKK
jgi:transcriptional regulator with XRE-family HTH domain